MIRYLNGIRSNRIAKNLTYTNDLPKIDKINYLYFIVPFGAGLFLNLRITLGLTIVISLLFFLYNKLSKRAQVIRFGNDLIIFIQLLRALSQSGLDLYSSFYECKKYLESSSPIYGELERILELEKKEIRFHDAVKTFGFNFKSREIDLFKISVELACTKGIAMSFILGEIQRFIQNSKKNSRKKSNAIIMQRLSVVIIVGILFVILFFQSMTSNYSILGSLNNELGKFLVTSGGLLIAIGLVGSYLIGTSDEY